MTRHLTSLLEGRLGLSAQFVWGTVLGALAGIGGAHRTAWEQEMTIHEAGVLSALPAGIAVGAFIATVLFLLRPLSEKGRWQHYMIWTIAGVSSAILVAGFEVLVSGKPLRELQIALLIGILGGPCLCWLVRYTRAILRGLDEEIPA